MADLLEKKTNLDELSTASTLFNNAILGKAINPNKILGRVLHNRYENINRDFYIKLVLKLLKNTKWIKVLNLNFTETIQLEHATFLRLQKFISEYKKESERITDEFLKENKERK